MCLHASSTDMFDSLHSTFVHIHSSQSDCSSDKERYLVQLSPKQRQVLEGLPFIVTSTKRHAQMHQPGKGYNSSETFDSLWAP
jgi:hypothetical protein